jgi:hypothetical protein
VKFNPITKRLYTDDNAPIKQLHCRYRMAWNALVPTDDESVRRCRTCDKEILDTAGVTDGALLAIVTRNPSACLKVSLDQDNLRVVNQDVR